MAAPATVVNDDGGPVASVEGLELLGEEWVWNGRSVGEPVEGAAERVWGEAATLRHVCAISTLRVLLRELLTTYGHAVQRQSVTPFSAHFYSSFYLERITLNRLR